MLILTQITFGLIILQCLSYCACAEGANHTKPEIGKISQQKCDEFWGHYKLNRRQKRSPRNNGGGGGGGGVNAEFYRFPHMAALGFGDYENVVWGCGGSLISPKFIMTAAHCTHNTELGKVKYIRLGVTLLREYLELQNYQDFNVSRIIKHPDFKPPLVYNDIALLELSKPAIIAHNVKPACLFTETNIPNDKTWFATGWGVTSHNGNYANHLQQLNLRQYSYEQCSKAFNDNNKRRLNRGIDNDTQICAGEVGQDTCDGDSGGPIQIHSPNYKFGFTIIGVTSFGKPCLLTTNPGVYTKVSAYIEWIENIVWNEDMKKENANKD